MEILRFLIMNYHYQFITWNCMMVDLITFWQKSSWLFRKCRISILDFHRVFLCTRDIYIFCRCPPNAKPSFLSLDVNSEVRVFSWFISPTDHNKELIEIRDEQMLAHLKYEYNKEYLLYRTDTPIIRGTVVNRLLS